ncbi:LysE family transporter [bacterium BFN5]|nr:LysE family transporter [bacterium BFN5]
MIVAFFHGVILALGLILPLGVQNVFVFNQGAVQPTAAKMLPAVIAASLCDTLLILLAVGGVSVLVLSIAWVKTGLISVGVAFLLYAGWLTWNTTQQPQANQQDAASWTIKRQIVFAVSVSLLNPHAIMDTIGVIGTSSLSYTGTAKMAFVAACILVSWVWFCFLAIAGKLVRSSDHSGRLIQGINRVSAVIMWLSAAYLLLSL